MKSAYYNLISIFLQAMESKLLVGGKNIVDHTNEQQKMLELKRQEIAEQVRGSIVSLLYCYRNGR